MGIVRKQADGSIVLSPTDLSGYLACPHLTTLHLAVARGELEKPFRPNLYADLIRRKGEEHEAAYLARLRAEGREVTEICFDGDWMAAARATEDAVAAGAEVIYQACLADGDGRGFADFLERRPDGGYEAVDTKLARHARPEHILQLCFYTEQVARLQCEMPEAMHVVNGLGERERFRSGDFLAYYDRVRRRLLDAIANGAATYPYPVEHCGLCDFLSLCKQRWEDDDHLVLVAGISRSQVERLTAADVSTLTRLGEAARETRVRKLNPTTFEKLRHQAELQLHRRQTGEHRVDLLPIAPERGLALLPAPSPGDIWLDFEGDPWFEPARGLEYLFGWVFLDENLEPKYECLWARDRTEEKASFERLLDLVTERRRRFPGMHAYHYAPYERTALQRLMGEHGTRESEIDDLLRGEALVDLYRVSRQALRASVSSYSIKQVEELYSFRRAAEVGGGSESVYAFEQWLEVGDDTLLDGIRAYNEEDCRSLYALHLWLLDQRPAELPWRPPPERREPSEEAAERLAARERVRDGLLAGAIEDEPRWLLAQLLDYHRREEKPQWWEYFHHRELDAEELLEDTETIGGLELVSRERDGQSFVYTFAFPAQEHKIGGEAVDPRTEKVYSVAVDDELGTVQLRRGVKREGEPLPQALIPPKPLPTWVQRDAVLRFAEAQGDYPALVDILERRPPRARLDGSLVEAALSRDGSYLFVQGPPGSGKTWNGAHAAIALMRAAGASASRRSATARSTSCSRTSRGQR
jgi:predicted RecB family nuclease